MESWITLWKYICIAGFGLFYLLVLFIIPLGAKDMLALFKKLGSERDKEQ